MGSTGILTESRLHEIYCESKKYFACVLSINLSIAYQLFYSNMLNQTHGYNLDLPLLYLIE